MIWNGSSLARMDFRFLPVILGLMLISTMVLLSHAPTPQGAMSEEFVLSPFVRSQLQWFFLGTGVYLLSAGLDYNRLREWVWILYFLIIVALIGVFFSDPINGVRRWYRIPFLRMGFQPSEQAKLIVLIALSWFLERNQHRAHQWKTALYAGAIVGVPFLLILKQPDLGSALVLLPVTLSLFYFGGVNRRVFTLLSWGAVLLFSLVAAIFLGAVTPETIRPYASKVLREYQFDRLDPNSHHQRAACTAIAYGGLAGTGWRKSEFTRGGWLPYPYTDSVFPAFGEEFGFVGLTVLMGLFYVLLSLCFQVILVAKDPFGRLLAAGVSTYLAMHIFLNIGMMIGFLPITGVPLPLISYGGSSMLMTMMSLGILQSIYSRRFMF